MLNILGKTQNFNWKFFPIANYFIFEKGDFIKGNNLWDWLFSYIETINFPKYLCSCFSGALTSNIFYLFQKSPLLKWIISIKYFHLGRYIWNNCDNMTPVCVFIHLSICSKCTYWIPMNKRKTICVTRGDKYVYEFILSKGFSSKWVNKCSYKL